MKISFVRLGVIGLGLLAGAVSSFAAVKPNGLFTNGAVLQQEMEVPVWGTARDGEKVTVKFQDQEISTTAKGGQWMVKLKPLKVGGPFVMTITGDNTVELKDLLVGEVWICSGQSNMEFVLKEAAGANEAILAAKDPQLRLYTVPRNFQALAQTVVTGTWETCTSEEAAKFSAVGYFFGRDLRAARKVPVGLISSSVGGTPAQAWTSVPTLKANSLYRSFFEGHEKSISTYTVAEAKFKEEGPKLMEKWEEEAAKAKEAGKPAPPKPVAPVDPTNRGPGCLYNGMIAPLEPYAMRGVIWYQGESNVNNPALYRVLFPALIHDWRTNWGEGEFPFLFVQIAPYHGLTPELRDAQLETWQTTPKTAMVVITDHGEALNIHPKEKEPVGARLALAARAIAYGETIEYSGPVFDSMKVEGSNAVLSFTHLGDGLMVEGLELKGFTMCGSGTNFMAARAILNGNTVVVSNPEVPTPKIVRYGWANVPDINLFNQNGLPASPFETSEPKKPIWK